MNRNLGRDGSSIKFDLVAKQRLVIRRSLEYIPVFYPSVYKQRFATLNLENPVHPYTERRGQKRGLGREKSRLSNIVPDRISMFVLVGIPKIVRQWTIIHHKVYMVSAEFCLSNSSVLDLPEKLELGKFLRIWSNNNRGDLESINVDKRPLHLLGSFSADLGLCRNLKPLSDANPTRYGSKYSYPDSCPAGKPVGWVFYFPLGFARYGFAFRIVEETNAPRVTRRPAIFVFLIGAFLGQRRTSFGRNCRTKTLEMGEFSLYGNGCRVPYRNRPQFLTRFAAISAQVGIPAFALSNRPSAATAIRSRGRGAKAEQGRIKSIYSPGVESQCPK